MARKSISAGTVEPPDEVGEEEHAALEHGHEQDPVGVGRPTARPASAVARPLRSSPGVGEDPGGRALRIASV